MNPLSLVNRPRNRKIAITGIANGGKTVFLTSLLWQLAEVDNARFHLDEGVKISRFRELPAADRTEKFPFEKYRDALARSHEWPGKTRDINRFSCEFKRSDYPRPQRLDFLDFPGERMADTAICECDDFGEWSDRMFEYFDSDSDYSEAVSRYRNAIHVDDLSADITVRAYRLMLANLILDYKPLVSPSVFLLDRRGDVAKHAPAAILAAERLCGVDTQSQFAPLPKLVRNACPKLRKEMGRHYRRYRKELVLPLFKDLAESHSLVVLIDIPSLLVGGIGRYNDNRRIVFELFNVIPKKSNESFFGGLRKWFRSSSLQRIAFVAAKADLVTPNDLKSARLKSLLHQMTARVKDRLPDVEVKWFHCAACRSTEAGGTESTLVGRPSSDNPERSRKEFPVSPLPETWPGDWEPKSYQFPDVFPRISPNVQIPPDHLMLDDVFDFVAIR